MDLFLFGLLALTAGAVLALFLPGPWKTRSLILFSFAAFILILIPSFIVLFTNRPLSIVPGSLIAGIDAVGAFFQMMIASIFCVSVLFLSGHMKKNSSAANGRTLFCMTLFAAAFLLLTVARNMVLFLLAWQVMVLAFALASGGLKKNFRELVHFESGFLLIAAGIIVFLLSSTVLPGAERVLNSAGASIAVFVLLLSGFALTAAWPFFAGKKSDDTVHSLFSVFLFAAGAFGLFRAFSWTANAGLPVTAATLVVFSAAVTVVSAVLAISKKNIPSFLSHTVPLYFGITGLAIGMGMTGMQHGNTLMAVAGFSAAFFQVVNHVIARTLVLFSSGIRSSARSSAAVFFVFGALAMIGLPMLDGNMNFFLNSFGVASAVGPDIPLSVLRIVLLAGTVLPVLFLFLFFSRTCSPAWFLSGSKPAKKEAGGSAMFFASLILTALVFVTGIFPQYVAIFTVNPAADLAKTAAVYTDNNVMSAYSRIFNSLNSLSKTLLTFAGLFIILYIVRLFVLTKREMESAVRGKAAMRRSGR